MKSFFEPRQVIKILAKLGVRITYDMLASWDRLEVKYLGEKFKFLPPSYRRRGKYRLYTFSDIVKLLVAASLCNKKINSRMVAVIAKFNNLVSRMTWPLVETTIMLSGTKVALAWKGGFLMDPETETAWPDRFEVAKLRETINTVFPGPVPASAAQVAAVG